MKNKTRIELTGQIFTYWKVVKFSHIKNGKAFWFCRCKCGTLKTIGGYLLRSQKSKSCGCFRTEFLQQVCKDRATHGEGSNGKETPEYRAWCQMKSRCINQNHVQWENYGGRGIRVCKRWMKSYKAFLDDMGRKPNERHSLDRINNDGNYTPKNCRWATPEEQNSNQRKRKYVPKRHITIDGVTKPIKEWINEANCSERTFYRRLSNGMTPKKALTFKSKFSKKA